MYTITFYTEYDMAWSELYVAIPEKGLHLTNEESVHKPLCFTNYRPHYNPKALLDNLIVGQPKGWTYVEHHQPVDKYGYKDERPYWDVSTVYSVWCMMYGV